MGFAFWRGFRQKAKDAQPESVGQVAESVFYSPEELFRPFLLLFAMVLLILVSCLAVVMSAFEYRQLFNQHQKLIHQRDELQVEWGQLLLEQSAWAANNRVEQQATTQLGMKVPDIDQIEIVKNESAN